MKTSMWYDNRQIDAYRKHRSLKRHEERMLARIRKGDPRFKGKLLDVGCANGLFLEALAATFPQAGLTGIDLSRELIGIAKKKLAGKKVELLVRDTMTYSPAGRYDVVVASGVLSIFEEFEPVLKKWVGWLKPSGKLYIFGRFNSKPIDTIIRFRNHHTRGSWESGMTTYSVSAIGAYLKKLGLSYKFERFHLGLTLKPSADPVRTFTVRCADGSTLVMNGANIVSEQFFLTIRKP